MKVLDEAKKEWFKDYNKDLAMSSLSQQQKDLATFLPSTRKIFTKPHLLHRFGKVEDERYEPHFVKLLDVIHL